MRTKHQIKKLNIYLTAVGNYVIRDTLYDNRQHIIVPVVMMVEGVHSGSGGPLLHRAEVLGNHVEAWEGMPVMVGHPHDGSGYVSANSPEMLPLAVGKIFNAHMEGDKLKAEAWIDVQKLTALSPEALEYIMSGRALDVSIGVFTDEETVTGEYKGESYSAIARNHIPDHLALLPGEQGACGWKDGCGIRDNIDESIIKTNLKLNENVMLTKDQIKVMKTLPIGGDCSLLEVNVQGYNELISNIQTKLDSMDNDMRIYFFEELYDDYVIYRVRARESGETTLYKQTYQTDTDGVVEFTGDPSKVRRETEYVTLTNTYKRTINNKKGETEMTKANSKTPCCLAKVEQLIANKLTHFTEDNKEWLLEQDEEVLDTLFPIEPTIEANKKVEEAPKVDEAAIIKAYKATLTTPEAYIDEAPKEVQESMRAAMRVHKQQKDNLVQLIITNSGEGTWTKEQLDVYDIEVLTKMATTLKVDVKEESANYSLNGGTPPIQANQVEPLYPVGVEIETETEKSK